MSSHLLCVPQETESPTSFRKKPRSSRLHLEANDQPSQHPDSPNPIQIKSAQNCKSKKFVFPSIDRCRQIITALQRLHVLEKEKRQLLAELRSLREGALSAIIQKEQTIEQLRQKIQEVESNHSRDSEDLIRGESYVTTRLQQTSLQMEELHNERQQIREQHIQQIVHKDHLIVELGEELQKVKGDITSLEVRDRILADRINQIEQENESLHDELVRSRSSLSEMKDSLKGSVMMNRSFGRSIVSSPERNLSGTLRLLNTQESKEHDHNEYSFQLNTVERLRQINEQQKELHRREVERLRIYYEQALNVTLNSNRRNHTIASQENSEDSEQRSLTSYKEEECRSERLATGALKNEIQLIVEPYQPSNLFAVDMNNPEKRLPTAGSVDECESQFSYKHFQYDLPRLTTTDNSTTISKIRMENNLSANEAIRLANRSTHSRHSRSSSAALLNASTHSKHPIKVGEAEQILNKPGVKYGIFAGGMLLSIGVLYAVYRTRN